MKRAILVYNHMSGDHSIPKKLDYIIGRFQDKGVLIQPFRFKVDEQLKLLEVLRSNSFDFIVVSGGDGTLNLVINIVLKNKIGLSVGIIPSGTCNDFARSLNIPNAVHECIDIILHEKTTDVDVGLINENKYFLNTCAGGAFVEVSFNTHSELKRNFGPFAYYLKALNEVKNIRNFDLKIKIDTGTIEEKALLFLILNGKDAAGFTNLVQEADVSDGKMDIVIIKNCSHIDLASIFFKVLSNELVSDRNVTTLSSGRCTIEGMSDIVLSIDGDEGMSLPINIRFINKALKVFVK